MATYTIEPAIKYLHGHYSSELPPVLTIGSGDVIRYQTPDVGWHTLDSPDSFEPAPKIPGRDRERDPGHALSGPIAIEGAKAGMTLEVYLKTIRTSTWGWSSGGGFPSEWNERLVVYSLSVTDMPFKAMGKSQGRL